MQKQQTRTRQSEPPSAELIEAVLLAGDLSQLTPDQRLSYYKNVCQTLGLNPLTKPFDYITLDGKLVLYARKDCTEQLRKLYDISLKIVSRESADGVYAVVAQAKLGRRVDEAMGAVPLEIVRDGKTIPLTAAAKANNMMKAETKSKRRVTLSICGLGMLDESEIELVEYAQLPPHELTNGIIERNVKEATANATGEPLEKKAEAVTEENFRDVVCHVGKAEGNILGKKIGEIHPKIITWLVEKWIPKLPEVPNEKDARLRDAVLLAQKHPRDEGEATANVTGEPVEKAVEPPKDIGARNAAMNDLRGRIEDLVLTEEQFMAYLNEQGVSEQKWEKLDDMPDSMLLYLCTPNAWKVIKEAWERRSKPKVDETIKPKRGRKKEKGPFDV